MRHPAIPALVCLLVLAGCTMTSAHRPDSRTASTLDGPSEVAGLPVDTSHAARSQNSRVQFIVLHYTELDFSASLDILTRGEVSSHYLVDADPPRILRLVPEHRRAWHAGRSSWQGQTALNAASIGIEIVNPGNRGRREGPFAPWDEAQVALVVELVRDIARRHAVLPHRIVAHSDIQPQVKQDPGPEFPWQRLVAAGLIPWPDAAQVAVALPAMQAGLPTVAWFQEKLATHGFEVPRHGELDEATRRVIACFQMKYRPSKWDGQPDAETAAWLQVATEPGGLLIVRDGQRVPYRPD